MLLVGGPQGSGKSTFFPVAEMGMDSFNIDEERRRLNRGSSQEIPPEVQRLAAKAYESFIESHVESGKSFAIEAARARAAGFRVRLFYVAAGLDQCEEYTRRA